MIFLLTQLFDQGSDDIAVVSKLGIAVVVVSERYADFVTQSKFRCDVFEHV